MISLMITAMTAMTMMMTEMMLTANPINIKKKSNFGDNRTRSMKQVAKTTPTMMFMEISLKIMMTMRRRMRMMRMRMAVKSPKKTGLLCELMEGTQWSF